MALDRALLEGVGIDVEDGLHRFLNNEDLLVRFLKKFPSDESYNQLVAGLESGNVEEAFRAAHTLKGLCGNLSMNVLQKIVAEQVEFLRAGDIEGGAKMMPQVTAEYEKIMAVIATL